MSILVAVAAREAEQREVQQPAEVQREEPRGVPREVGQEKGQLRAEEGRRLEVAAEEQEEQHRGGKRRRMMKTRTTVGLELRCSSYLADLFTLPDEGPDAGGGAGAIPLCRCEDAEPAVEKTVTKESANKGRKFLGCAKGMSDGCGFFAWSDEGGGDGGAQVVPKKRPPPNVSRLSSRLSDLS